MSETIDIEPTQAVALRPSQDVAPGLFGTQEPVSVIERATTVATALKAVVSRQGLISRISGKEYPRCEAWTLLGTMLGVFPVCLWTKQVDGGWEARVEAKTKDGATIGAAEAQCLRSERNWKDRDDFALRSMAQTRATAKCLRMPLGFVMTLAGYEATPAEEMAPEPQPEHHAPNPAPTAAKPAAPKFPTTATRDWAVKELVAMEQTALDYLRKLGQLLDTESLKEWPLRFVPSSKAQLAALQQRIEEFANGEPAVRAFEPHDEPGTLPPAPKVQLPEGESVTGTIEHVSEKHGQSKKGAWTLYGIKVNGEWFNTFSATVGERAKELQGRNVRIGYETTDKGKNATTIEEA